MNVVAVATAAAADVAVVSIMRWDPKEHLGEEEEERRHPTLMLLYCSKMKKTRRGRRNGIGLLKIDNIFFTKTHLAQKLYVQ